MAGDSTETGTLGEKIAAQFLIDKGYKIVCQNWRCRWGEIDIIAQDGNTIVFVEVKTASSRRFGHPSGWVNAKKQSHIVNSAKQYILDGIGEDTPVRFDVLAVDLRNNTVEHIVSAFVLGDEG